MASRCLDFDEQMCLKKVMSRSPMSKCYTTFSKYLTELIFKIFVSTQATKKMKIERLFKILDLIYLFPCSPKGNGKLKGFHLNGDKMSFQNTLPILSFSTQATKEWKIGFHLNGDKVSFQKTWTCLFISTQATEEWKIERTSPEWGPSVFSKYST